MANKKKKQTREERLEKKRQAERLRYQRLKRDPVKNAELKEKEKEKYIKKKEKGLIKSVKDMTEREQRAIRKIWREKTKKLRERRKQKSNQIAPPTPPDSDNEDLPVNPQMKNNRALAAKRRSDCQRKMRNKIIRRQNFELKTLRQKIKNFQKKIKRIYKKQDLTPNSKVETMLKDTSKSNVESVKKKLLFSEVMESQIRENMSCIENDKEKKIVRKVLSGRIVKKYKVLDRINIKPIKQSTFKRLLDMERKTRGDKTSNNLNKIITQFFEEDCNSRQCPGKKDCITRKKIKKQKRYLQDSMRNLHQKFLKTKGIIISYTLFCRMRPFWVVTPQVNQRETCLCVIHANIDLILHSLKQSNILLFGNYQSMLEFLCCDKYNELCLSRECKACKHRTLPYQESDNCTPISYFTWRCVTEEIIDMKTKKERKVRKYTKSTLKCPPQEVVLKLENDLVALLKHEYYIVHQYQSIKTLKDNLTENDAVIHMDFSENFNTKYAEEVQSFHFGGARTQISLHTVVVYTKGKTECFATLSEDLSHNVPAIWAHLQPIINSLPDTIQNVHFLSDGPVTQYRNKDMFFYLGCLLTKLHPHNNITDFTWNYFEAGHGKGAPDGVGGTCKRTADKIIASGTDIATIDAFAKAIEEHCPGIRTLVINRADISSQTKILNNYLPYIKPFVGTLKVHQVRANVFIPLKLKMKSLSCFCSNFCPHYNLGQMTYPGLEAKLDVSKIFADAPSEMHDVPEMNSKTQMPSRSKNLNGMENNYSNGDYVLVSFQNNKKSEYRYVGVCSSDMDEDGEILITFLKIWNAQGNIFKLDDNDVSHVPVEQICEKLPQPNIFLQGNRILYKFKNPVNVYEK